MIRKTFQFLARNFFDVKGALGVDALRESYGSMKDMGKKVFKRRKAKKPETFEEAKKRLKIDDAALKARYEELKKAFYLLAGFSMALFLYSLFLFFEGFPNAGILCFSVTVLAVLQAFKRHFWMFQIRQKKLGCTFKEYWASIRESDAG